MFDKLIDKLVDCISFFYFMTIMRDYQQGVVLRLGKYHRTLEPGLRFHWPCGIEDVLYDDVVWSTYNLDPQSLITKDDVDITVGAIITWKVHNIKKILLEVEGKHEVMVDCAYGEIASLMMQATYEEARKPEMLEAITKAVRAKAFKYGIEVSQVRYSDFAKGSPIRMWHQHTLNQNTHVAVTQHS